MDDKYVAIGMANSRIHVFDVKTGKLKRNLYGHTQGVWALGLISKNPIDAESQYTSAPNHRSKSSMGGAEDPMSQSRRASIDTTARMQFGILPAFGILDSGPREAKRMKSSEVCGSSMGWPGLRKDLAVSGGSDRALRVWDLETG
jgi:F-box and WD-40 domain protein CDC4